MSSPSRAERHFLLLAAASIMLAACDRETRDYRSEPFSETRPIEASGADPRAQAYQANAYQLAAGQHYYSAFNCAGCHGPGGGGGMGPPFSDEEWRYGGEMEDVVRTIMDGRPNGMPAFRGRITDGQAWQLAAYVRSLSGQTPGDTRSGRSDDMMTREPPSLEERTPVRTVTPQEDAATPVNSTK
jgi:cytochrome c oxidase cbb3-type subunit III